MACADRAAAASPWPRAVNRAAGIPVLQLANNWRAFGMRICSTASTARNRRSWPGECAGSSWSSNAPIRRLTSNVGFLCKVCSRASRTDSPSFANSSLALVRTAKSSLSSSRIKRAVCFASASFTGRIRWPNCAIVCSESATSACKARYACCASGLARSFQPLSHSWRVKRWSRGRESSCRPVASQKRTVLSSPTEARMLPSGEKVNLLMR